MRNIILEALFIDSFYFIIRYGSLWVLNPEVPPKLILVVKIELRLFLDLRTKSSEEIREDIGYSDQIFYIKLILK